MESRTHLIESWMYFAESLLHCARAAAEWRIPLRLTAGGADNQRQGRRAYGETYG